LLGQIIEERGSEGGFEREFRANCREGELHVGLIVMVIDESLGEAQFVKQLLEELENVGLALVTEDLDNFTWEDLVPDVFVLGANWLDRARQLRKKFPRAAIIGRGPWQGNTTQEFFPWGDELREPTLPITSLIPKYSHPA